MRRPPNYTLKQYIRDTKESIQVLGITSHIWHSYLYRPVSRLLHRYNLHYMKPNTHIDPDKIHYWCEWCGLRDTIEKEQRIPTLHK
jgi:hypothetical protein